MAKVSKEALVLQSKPVTAAVLAVLNGGGEKLASTFRARLFDLFASNPQDVVATALDAKVQGIKVSVDGIRSNDYARLEEARALFRAWKLPRAREEVLAYSGGWGKLVAFARSVQSAVASDEADGRAEQKAMATVLVAEGKTLADVLNMDDDARKAVAAKVEAVKAETQAERDAKAATAKAVRMQPAKVAAAWIKAHEGEGFEWMHDVGAEIVRQIKAARIAATEAENARIQAGDDAAAANVKAEYAKAANIKAAA